MEQLNIRTGHNSVTGIGSTVVMGSKDSDFSSPAPSHIDPANNVVLNVGVVTCNSVFGKVNGLTYPHQNGTDGYVLTSDGAGTAAWEVNPGGGSGAGSINVAAVTSDDNFYHLTFVSGTSGAQDVKVSAGVTVRNDHLFANHITARGYNDPASLMNEASIHSDGGLELKRNNHNVTSGGPYIDFTKNIVSYPDIETTAVDTTVDTFTTSTNIVQREWSPATNDISTVMNYVNNSATDHDLVNGDPVRYIGSTNDQIVGITPGITYYAVIGNGGSPNQLTTTAFRLSLTEADAKSGSPTIINITNAGSGTHTFKLGTLNTGDVLKYKGSTGTNINVNVDAFVFVVANAGLDKFRISDTLDHALAAVPNTMNITGSPNAVQKFEVSREDFDARIQLDSLAIDDASILFRTPVPGTSLPSAVGKSQVRMEVTREGAVVSGIMTVAHSSNRLDGTENYIQTGIGTHFIKEADADELVLTRDYRSKMIVFDKDIQTDDDKTVKIPYNVFGYGDSMTFYNAGTKICTINANGGSVRIYLAGTNVYAALGYGTPGNTGKVFLSPKAMATLTYTHHDGVVDDFVITGGGVYV